MWQIVAEGRAGVEVYERDLHELLQRLEECIEVPMLVLAFVWPVPLTVELVPGESLPFDVIGTIS